MLRLAGPGDFASLCAIWRAGFGDGEEYVRLFWQNWRESCRPYLWQDEAGPAEYLAKTIYGEARGCSTTEQAAVVWCVLNRVDDESGLWPDDIVAVVTQPSQFHGYDPDHPVLPELLALAEDVLSRWEIEDSCVGDVGRVLPREYTYFSGDGRHNYFRTEWDGGTTWDWGLESPYGDLGA